MQEDLRCKKCDGSQTRLRVKTNERICYSCGHIEKIDMPKLIEESPQEIVAENPVEEEE